MNSTPVPLATLNRLSREHAFGLDDIDWTLGVDRSRRWMPEALTPISFAPSHALLDERQRLRCNQLQALAVIEKFIWFERMFSPIVDRVRRDPAIPSELALALAHFIEEEARHVLMFQRLLRACEPLWYGRKATRLFKVARWQRHGMALARICPRVLPAWIWLFAFVEERAVFLARACLDEVSGRLDPLHRRVHELHLRDESRHCQLDKHLLAHLYQAQPAWRKQLADAMVGRLLATGMRAGAAAPQVVRQLGLEFPELRARVLPRLLAELPMLHRDPRYRHELFGGCASSRIQHLLRQHPEQARALRMLTSEAAP